MHNDNHTQAKTKKKSDFIPCSEGIMQGWVKLQRSILQQEIWAKPPEYLKIYTYLVVSVDRISGEFYTNYQTISETCGVKKTVVDHFFRWAKET